MTRVLVVNHRLPWPLDDGNALRVHELCRHVTPDIECHLACFPARAEKLADLEEQGTFASVTILPAVEAPLSVRRFLRLGNRDYHRLASPGHFAAVSKALSDIVSQKEIEVVVAVLHHSEEFTRPLSSIPRLVDQYDCLTLAAERQLALRASRGWRERLIWRLQVAAARSVERGLAERCDQITAIAPPDVSRLEALNPGARVIRIPNGVDESLLDRPRPPVSDQRRVVFWGNLSFSVNQQAIDHFIDQIWTPLLKDRGIGFTIVGPHASAELERLAAATPGLELAGFVDDLFGYLDRFPVMVNPMVTGGGLKNKVLEAFATGKAVVTSRLGIDAFPEVDQRHCRITDDPASTAEAICALLGSPDDAAELGNRARQLVRQHYTWRAVGESWSSLLRKLGGVQLRKGGGGGGWSGT